MIELGYVEHEPALRFNHKKQLFVDNAILTDWWKVTRIQEKVCKHPDNPVLVGDKPWETSETGESQIMPSSIIYDSEALLYKLWYHSDSQLTNGSVLYAESEDGIHWLKPDLGLIELEGNRKNNQGWIF